MVQTKKMSLVRCLSFLWEPESSWKAHHKVKRMYFRIPLNRPITAHTRPETYLKYLGNNFILIFQPYWLISIAWNIQRIKTWAMVEPSHK